MPDHRLFASLRSLCAAGVEFILIGGVAAVLQGAPIQTYDVDIVHSRDRSNVHRLLQWAEEADAIFRIQPERRLRPNDSHLEGAGHLNLLTRYGPVDLLAQVGHLGFPELLPYSSEMEIGKGFRVRVLSLEKVIALKEELGTDKDKAVLPILRQTLRESKKRSKITERPLDT